MKKIVIIGSGFGGLSAAALLAKKGYQVTVLEKNETIGGKARAWKKDGFLFDMGPSWYLMPDIFERFFHQIGIHPKDDLKLKRLDPSYRIFFENKNTIDISSNLDRNYLLFDKLEKDGAQKLKKYLEIAEYQYKVSVEKFLYSEQSSLKDFLNAKLVFEGSKLHLFNSMEKFAKKFFTSDEALKILQYTIVFLGGDPKNTPAIYALMAHVDFNLGVWYPEGGMNAVAEKIAEKAKEFGVKIECSQEVKKIETKNGKAKKVITNQGEFEADIVIANADYHHVETKLLDSADRSYPEEYWQKKTMAPSAFIMYLGLNKKVKNIQHHTLVLAEDWKKHFREIFDNPQWPADPSYYVCAPSVTDNTVAPPNHENLFFLVPMASGIEDTDEIRKEYEKKIIAHFEKTIGEKIADSIIVKRNFAINDFQSEYNAYKGSALGLSHTLLQTAYFRPKMRSKKVENLFYAGQYTHPGIGVPMVIIASEIIADLIAEEYEV